MSETAEATGRTLDEAKKAAAEKLGVSVDQCEFEVIEGASKGLFAKTNYKVVASIKKEKPAKTRPQKAAVDMPAAKEKTKAEPEAEDASENGEADEVVASDADGKAAAKLLQELLDAGGLKLKAKVDTLNGRYVNLKLTGDDAEHATKGGGTGLDALQYLSNALLSRSLRNGVRVTLDADEYRSKRAQVLMDQALNVAKAVVDRKQEAVLDPLPAHERRVIHNALQEFEGVETYSEGEEPNRRVVISPK